ncbi:hypothetical protein SAMN05421690_100462 [Nitrosomonas sp. Nm51]|nr:hypothetical protein SAMN05421690_100462 [Nitrosomonas sp. Nm51]
MCVPKEPFINNCNIWIASGGHTAALFAAAIACAMAHPPALHCIPPDAPNCHAYLFAASKCTAPGRSAILGITAGLHPDHTSVFRLRLVYPDGQDTRQHEILF